MGSDRPDPRRYPDVVGLAGELDDESGAAEGAVLDADLAVVAGHDGADDGKAEAASTLGSSAAVVEAGESFEDSFVVGGGIPRPSSSTTMRAVSS
jgi:hypothetical protein